MSLDAPLRSRRVLLLGRYGKAGTASRFYPVDLCSIQGTVQIQIRVEVQVERGRGKEAEVVRARERGDNGNRNETWNGK